MAILKFAKNVALSLKYTLPGAAEHLLPNLTALARQLPGGSNSGTSDLSGEIRDAARVLHTDVSRMLSRGLDGVKAAARGEFNHPQSPEDVASSFAEALGLDHSVFDNGFLSAPGGAGEGQTGPDVARAAAAGAASGVAAAARALTESPHMRMAAAASEATAKFARANLGAGIAASAQMRAAQATANQALVRMASFQEKTQRAYYEKSLEHLSANRIALAEISSKLTTLIEAGAVGAVATDGVLSALTGKTADFTRAFAAAGGFNLAEYIKIVQARARDSVAAGGMLRMQLAALSQNPAGDAAKLGLSWLAPGKRQLQQFDQFLGSLPMLLSERVGRLGDGLEASSAARTGFGSWWRGSLGGILRMLSVRPGPPAPDMSRGITTRAVAFDGTTRHAIVEVIPNYLSYIHAELRTLRGALAPDSRVADRMVFDYRTGRFGSAAAAAAEVRRSAAWAGESASARFAARIGASDDSRAAIGALASRGLSVDRAAGSREFRAQMETEASKAARAGDQDGARQIRALARQIGAAMDADPARRHNVLGEFQAAMLRHSHASQRVWNDLTDPGAHSAARMAFAGGDWGAPGGRSDSMFDLEAAFARGPGRLSTQDQQARRMEEMARARYPRGFEAGASGERLFRDASGKVTLRAVLRSPWVAISKAMDYAERGVYRALFGAPDEGGGAAGRIQRWLVGPDGSGPGGRGRGGLLGGAYDFIMGRARAARDSLLGKDAEKGLLAVAKERLLGAVERARTYLLGAAGEDGKRSGGVLSGPIRAGRDLLSRAGSAMERLADRMNERLFGEGGLVGRVEGIVRGFFYGSGDGRSDGFLKRVVMPARDWVAREVWDPIRKNTVEIWQQAGKFLRREVVDPLREALSPFVEEAKHYWESLKKWAVRSAKVIGGEIDGTFKRSFGKGLGDMLRQYVLDPIREALSGVRRMLGDAFRYVLRAAVRPFSEAGENLMARQIAEGRGWMIPRATRERLIRERGIVAPEPAGGRRAAAQARLDAAAAGSRGSGVIALGPGGGAVVLHAGGAATLVPDRRAYARARLDAAAAGSAGAGVVHLGATSPTAGVAATAAALSGASPEAVAAIGAAEAAEAASRGPRRGGSLGPGAAQAAAVRAAVETERNTRDIYDFMRSNLRGVGRNVARIAARMGAGRGPAEGEEYEEGGGLLQRALRFGRRVAAAPFRALGLPFRGRGVGGAFRTARWVAGAPFRAARSIIETVNDAVGWLREGMGEIFGALGDSLRGLTRAASFVAKEGLGVLGAAATEAGTALFGRKDSTGRRQGGLVPGLVWMLGTTGRELAGILGVLGKGLASTLFGGPGHRGLVPGALGAAGTLLGGAFKFAGGSFKAAYHGAMGSIRLVNEARGLTGSRAVVGRLTPVYVVGGYLAGTRGGARSLAEAEEGLTAAAGWARRLAGGVLSGVKSLFRGGDGGEESAASAALRGARGWVSRAGQSLRAAFSGPAGGQGAAGAAPGGFTAVSARITAMGAARTLAEWRHRLLASSEGSEAHLGAIRKGFGLIGDVLMAGIPAIAGLLGGIWEFFKGGSFIKTIAELLLGKKSLGGLAPAAEDAAGAAAAAAGGAAKGGLLARTLGRIPGAKLLGRQLLRIPGAARVLGVAGDLAGAGVIAPGAALALAGMSVNGLADLATSGLTRRAIKTVGTGMEYSGIGAGVGGVLGGVLGSVVPGLGTAAGAVAGASLGSEAGMAAGALAENLDVVGGALSWLAGAAGRALLGGPAVPPLSRRRRLGAPQPAPARAMQRMPAPAARYQGAADASAQLAAPAAALQRLPFAGTPEGGGILGAFGASLLGGGKGPPPAALVGAVGRAAAGGGVLGAIGHFLFGAPGTRTPDFRVLTPASRGVVGDAAHGVAQSIRLLSKAFFGDYDPEGNRIRGSSYLEEGGSIVETLAASLAHSARSFRDFLFGGDGRKNLLARVWDSTVSTVGSWAQGAMQAAKNAMRWTGRAATEAAQLPGNVAAAAGAGIQAAAAAAYDLPGQAAAAASQAAQGAASWVGGIPGRVSSYVAANRAGNPLLGVANGIDRLGGGIPQYRLQAAGAASAPIAAVGSGRADVMAAIQKAAKMVGVPVGYMMAVAQQESGFRPGAGASTSSARGLYQFTRGTWATYVSKYGAQFGIGLGDIDNPLANAIMGAEFAKDNQASLTRFLGRAPNPSELYAAHFLGAGGARSLLSALQSNPDMPASSVPGLGDAARANPAVFNGRTVAQVYGFLNAKVGQPAAAYQARYGGAAGQAQLAQSGGRGSPAAAPGGKPAAQVAMAAAHPAPANQNAPAGGAARFTQRMPVQPARIQGAPAPGQAAAQFAQRMPVQPARIQGASVSEAAYKTAVQRGLSAPGPEEQAPAPQAAPQAPVAPGMGAAISLLQQIAANTGDTADAVRAAGRAAAAATAGAAAPPAAGGGGRTVAFALGGGQPGAGNGPGPSPIMQRVLRG